MDGRFRTGDLGYLDDGGYLFITGRLREVINRGGVKIAPREIEELPLAHPAVSDAEVVGEPDPLYGQRVVAYIALNGSGNMAANALTEDDLRAYCAQRLSAYKVPEVFYHAPALPRNGNGKLNLRTLNKLDAHTMTRRTARASQDEMPQRMLAHG